MPDGTYRPYPDESWNEWTGKPQKDKFTCIQSVFAHGNSLFGPVISEVPDDEQALAFYDALRTFADFDGFSELKRTDRPPLDLPLLEAS